MTKGGLGLELDGAMSLGFCDIEKLTVALVGLSFPIDLSGGVARFRHRRGALEHMSLAARRDTVAAALAPAMRGVLGSATPAVTVSAISGGVMIGLCLGRQALAFDLLWAPTEGDARFVVCQARSIGVAAPALAAAARALDAVARTHGRRSGALVVFPDAAARIARFALPSAGARAPDAGEVRFGALESDSLGFRVACDRTFAPPHLSSWTVRELEMAKLAESADDALTGGDLDAARDRYAALLERSPKDAELARRLADLDRSVGGRTEAALATLTESMPLSEAGILGGELLLEQGEIEKGVALLQQAAEREAYGPLSALALLTAAEASGSLRERSALLDQAVARSPALEVPRWARFALRLDLADVKGAMADAEHLEAATRGSHRRHEVWSSAAAQFLAHGHHEKAINLFERALRYRPDNPATVSGLAQSLLAAGRTGRALDLMARAVELAERKGVAAHGSVMMLARALAETASDLPHAIARLRKIPAGEPESLDARGLEGRYRAMLGDIAGASVAYAKMRDAIEVTRGIETERAGAWLFEAARFERDRKGDLHAAQRHLAVALELLPHDAKILSAFREVAARVCLPDPAAPPMRAEPSEGVKVSDEERAQVLTDRLRGDPQNHAVSLELADILYRLGQDLELFALLSARLEEAAEKERPELLSRQKKVLQRLIEQARSDHRIDEARMYGDALERIS